MPIGSNIISSDCAIGLEDWRIMSDIGGQPKNHQSMKYSRILEEKIFDTPESADAYAVQAIAMLRCLYAEGRDEGTKIYDHHLGFSTCGGDAISAETEFTKEWPCREVRLFITSRY